jgi:hypothetical protein
MVKENMGHADFRTYEQHYWNARLPQEAEAFWRILPPGAAAEEEGEGAGELASE